MTDEKKTAPGDKPDKTDPPEASKDDPAPPKPRFNLVLLKPHGDVPARKIVSAEKPLADKLIKDGVARSAEPEDLAMFARQPIAIS